MKLGYHLGNYYYRGSNAGVSEKCLVAGRGLGINPETKEEQLQKKKRVRLEEEDPEA